MSMIKALRTLAAIENGTLNAAALETLISGSSARLDELRLLLSIASLRTRIIAGGNVSAALRGSATAKALFDDMATNTFDKTAWVNDLLVTPGGKLLLHANDTLLTHLATTPSLMAKARAQSKYAVISATAAGSSSVSLSGQMPGSAYILLGISSGVGAPNSHSVSTLLSGGTANVSTNASNDSMAMDSDMASPLVAPYSFTSQLGNNYASYFGVLRCDI
jgi:hypothetical protein